MAQPPNHRSYHAPARAGPRGLNNSENKMKALLFLCLAFPLVACSSDVEAESASPDAPAKVIADMAVATGTRTVQCGCSIEGIGKCGNYVEIDDQFVLIENSKALGLGTMEWCADGPAQAECTGAIKDGKFVAATLVVQE